MKFQISPIWKKVLKSCSLWLFVSIGFGLLQLWLSIGNKWLQDMQIQPDKYFLTGVLLFFSSGIAMSNSCDVWLEEKIDKNYLVNIIFHIVSPIALMILITLIYVITSDKTHLTGKIKYAQYIILAFSLIYSTCSKIQLYLARQKNKVGGN